MNKKEIPVSDDWAIVVGGRNCQCVRVYCIPSCVADYYYQKSQKETRRTLENYPCWGTATCQTIPNNSELPIELSRYGIKWGYFPDEPGKVGTNYTKLPFAEFLKRMKAYQTTSSPELPEPAKQKILARNKNLEKQRLSAQFDQMMRKH